MTTKHFKLENLSCPSCIMHLESMEDMEGIHRVNASFKKQTMTVDYDETLRTPADIVNYVAQMGYIARQHKNIDNGKKEGSRWTKLFRS